MALNLNFHYIPREGFLYSFDPRCKWIAFGILTFSTFYFSTISLFLVSIPLTAYFIIKHFRSVIFLITSKYWLMFLSLIFIMHSITFGERYPHIDVEGTHKGLLVCWKLSFIVILAQIFTSTTRPQAMKMSLNYFFKILPLKWNHRLSIMISMTLRFVPIFLDELEEVRLAFTARTKKTLNPIVFFRFVVYSFLRRILLLTEEYSLALLSRGYREEYNFNLPSLPGKDILILIVFCVFVIVIGSGEDFIRETIGLLKGEN